MAGDKVLMEFSTFGDRFLGLVTEVVGDGRLFVYAPVPQLVHRRFVTDRVARVRFAFEGALRGFDTRVLNRDNPPGLILELAAPGRIYDAEDRCEPRCPCRFPAMVADKGGGVRAVVEDMSASCTRVRLVGGNGRCTDGNGGSGWKPLSDTPEAEVLLTFFPFDMGDGCTVACVVRKLFMKDGVYFAVLEFKPEETAVRERIARFVEVQIECGIARL
nr:PilZ domain-containing protein [Pseudodesulfovibrio sp.]